MNNSVKTPTYEQLIETAITAPAENNLPLTAPVVAMLMEQYRPVIPPEPSTENCTSFEIVQILEDTCALSTEDVARTMVFLGYRLAINELKGLEWAMAHI